MFGITLVAVRHNRSDSLSSLRFRFHNGSDLLARISCVPLVEQILERCKLVAFRVERVEVVVDSDIANIKAWEYQLGILTDLYIVSAESGEVFCDERCHLALLHQLDKTLECRAVEAHA